MKEDKYFWFMILLIFWKTHVKVNAAVISKNQPLVFDSNYCWMHNDLQNLQNADKSNLISKQARLNDQTLDAAQKLN